MVSLDTGMMEPPRSAADEGLPALFWDTIPEDAEEHADYAGIQALIHDESTPDETAENFKVWRCPCPACAGKMYMTGEPMQDCGL